MASVYAISETAPGFKRNCRVSEGGEFALFRVATGGFFSVLMVPEVVDSMRFMRGLVS
jgi:hypothetical protein